MELTLKMITRTGAVIVETYYKCDDERCETIVPWGEAYNLRYMDEWFFDLGNDRYYCPKHMPWRRKINSKKLKRRWKLIDA